MLRSESRSGSFDFGRKRRTSVLSRTISAKLFCRGDSVISQIDSDAHAVKPGEQSLSKTAKLSKKEIVRISKMEPPSGQFVGQMGMSKEEEEMRMAKEQLGAMQADGDRAVTELREMRMVALEANAKLTESLSSGNMAETREELKSMTVELRSKDKTIESLKLELKKAKEIEGKLGDRETYINVLKEELNKAKALEGRSNGLLTESKNRIKELEDEIEKSKLSETNMYDTVVSQSKQLEQTAFELQQSEQEISSLREKIKNLEVLPKPSTSQTVNVDFVEGTTECLMIELQLARENLARALENEEVASSQAGHLIEEMNVLKSELKLAIEAEEKSKKAMDDLALALKEVATEANQAKEKLTLTELELKHVKVEAEQWKGIVKSSEEKYQNLLKEANKDIERYKNTVERLRLETEESSLAWNDKEMGFVTCIKRAEEESTRLIASLRKAENMTKASKEENFKLRDILKQALNEANVAKEAASLAREENSILKDSLVAKEDAIDCLIQENERLRVNEAAAQESMKELKHLLSLASKRDLNSEMKVDGILKSAKSLEEGKARKGKKKKNSVDFSHQVLTSPNEHEDECYKAGKGKKKKNSVDFNLQVLTLPEEHEDEINKILEEDLVKDDGLKGSIFDNPESPKPESPETEFSSCAEDGESVHSEDLDHLHRSGRRRALLRRVGDLLKRKHVPEKAVVC